MVVDELDSGGFRSLLETAIRREPAADWSEPSVDYDAFKKRLRFFAHRRGKIRRMLDESSDGRVAEEVLYELMGPRTPFPSPQARACARPVAIPSDLPKKNAQGIAGCVSDAPYVPFGEEGDPHYYSGAESSDAESLSSMGSLSTGIKRRNKRSIMRRLSNAERNEVMIYLHRETDKACSFYQVQWQKLSHLLDEQQQQQQQQEPAEQLVPLAASEELGHEILELLAFCVITIVTVHQALIRYDAFARAFQGTPMRSYYLKHVKKKSTSFRKLLHHEELLAVAESFARMQAAVVSTTNSMTSSSSIIEQQQQPMLVDGFDFNVQRAMFQDILLSLEVSDDSSTVTPPLSFTPSCTTITATTTIATSSKPRHGWKGSMVSLWKMFMIGLFEDRLGLEPAYLTGRGRSLTVEMEQLVLWRKKKQQIPRPKVQKKLTGMQTYHLTLNLLSAFLYCMNYYIVEPSSTMYVNRLGALDTMSGTLIGMMPLAAFVSSVPYSMWTNRSFRHPLLMSCCMLVLGNMCYSVADQFGSFRMALLGRFIAGLGAPKCIIRRYMADTTPVSLRTSVNAGFGMVVAAGSAMGPAMAVLLNKYEYVVAVPHIGIIILNGLTLPGFFMAALWTTFGLIVLATFEEPHREGLLEQKELEQNGGIPGSPSFAGAANGNSNTPSPTLQQQGQQLVEDELLTIFSGETQDFSSELIKPLERASAVSVCLHQVRNFLDLITMPVRICLGLLLAKVFTIESLVSATSALSKNRYGWQVQSVGTLGFVNGLLVIPFSILIGRLSLSYQDRVLMRWLVCGGCLGFFFLVDLSDLFVGTQTSTYNEGHPLAVNQYRYIGGYFLSYLSIQAFEGVIGSTLSKVIPTALASGTFNSGLLATLVDTFGRSCGDMFISMVGFINLRQLMNLLFIPGFGIMLTCLLTIERNRDLLSV